MSTKEQKLAEILHKHMCTSNHIDGCSFHCETWDNYSTLFARDVYLNKAKKLLEMYPTLDAPLLDEFLDVMYNSR